MNELRIEVLQDYEEVSGLASDWNSLLENQPFKTVYQAWEFHRSWWIAFGKDYSPFVIVVRDGQSVKSILPIVRSNDSGKSSLRFWGAPNFDYHDLIGDNSSLVVKSIMDFLIGRRSEWENIYLEQISERSQTLNRFRQAAAEAGVAWIARETDRCHIFEYDGPAEKRAEYRLHRGRNFKKAVNHFNRMNGFELEKINKRDEALNVLDILFHMHLIRWKGTPSPSKFHSEQNRLFYRELVNNLWDSKNICIMLLTVGGVPTVCALNFEIDGQIYHYTISYNRFFAKRSPGAFFVTLQTERFIQQGFDLDFCRGSQDYKEAISSASFANCELRICSSSLTASIARLYEWLKRSTLISCLITNPAFMKRKYTFDAFAMNHGKFIALLKTLSGHKFAIMAPMHKLYEIKTDEISQAAASITVVKLQPADCYRVASFMGIVDESEAFIQIKNNFERGDIYLGATTGGLLTGVVRITYSIENVPSDFPVIEGQTQLLADLVVAPTDYESEICAALVRAAAAHTQKRIMMLLLNSIAGPDEKLIQSVGFSAVR